MGAMALVPICASLSRARKTILIGPILEALFPCGGPIQDPVLTPWQEGTFNPNLQNKHYTLNPAP
jgi:hypothetical protein